MAQVFNCSVPQFVQRFKEAKVDWRNSRMRRDLRVLRRVGVSTTHTKERTQWTIDDIENMDANEAKFPDPDNRTKTISVAKYFKTKYNMNLQPGRFAHFSLFDRTDIFQAFLL
jgi:eukaryotic translation initiation factor 2C